MYGKLAIVFAIAFVLVSIAGAIYGATTSQLKSVDMTCAPLKTYDLYNNQLTVHNTVTGKDITYNQNTSPNISFCTYEFNYAYASNLMAFAVVIVLLLIAIVAFVILNIVRER